MPKISNLGEKLNLDIRQGTTMGPYIVTLTDTDGIAINLTGCLIRGKLRKTYADVASTADLVVSITGPTLGVFEFSLTDETTAAIAAGPYFWDAEVEYTDGTVYPLFRGVIQVYPEATK